MYLGSIIADDQLTQEVAIFCEEEHSSDAPQCLLK